MQALVRIRNGLDAFVSFTGKVAAWIALPLIVIILFDIVTRKIGYQLPYFSSTKLQELEWHLHTALFAFCIGWAYLANAHVRIDLVRDRLPVRSQYWLELVGIPLFLMTYTAILTWFGTDYAWKAYTRGECSAAMTGLCDRWIIKAALPLGTALTFTAGLAVLLRRIVLLFGPPDEAEEVRRIEAGEEADIIPHTEDAL